MKTSITDQLIVDIYPVGWLASVKRAYRYFIHHDIIPRGRKQAWIELRTEWRYTLRQIKRRKWHDVKNSFNGYLAEPQKFPPGDYVRCCGTGWTKARALRSLLRQLPSSNK